MGFGFSFLFVCLFVWQILSVAHTGLNCSQARDDHELLIFLLPSVGLSVCTSACCSFNSTFAFESVVSEVTDFCILTSAGWCGQGTLIVLLVGRLRQEDL